MIGRLLLWRLSLGFSAASDYLEDELLDHVCRKELWGPAADLYLALFTASTGLEGNSPTSEVTGGAYARKEIDGTTYKFTVASGGSTENTEQWDYTLATADWGTITHVALVDAVTAGNVLLWVALDDPVVISNGDTFRFLAGNLKFTLS